MSLPQVKLNVTRSKTPRYYMLLGEQDVLVAMVKSVQPRIMVEIGVNMGLTAQAMLREVPTIERYFGIDVDPSYQFEIPAQAIEHPGEPGRLVKDDPRFLLLMNTEPRPAEADVVFIDGDHGRNAVREDSDWAAKVVRPGGMILWHDYQNPTVQVTGVLDALKAEGRDLYHLADTWLVFERR